MNKSIYGILFFLIIITLSGCGRTEPSITKTADDLKKTEFNCEAPCANYVNKCLTLVPGATQQLYVDGLNSCVKECGDWGVNKAECILNAENCTSMTEDCDL